jgi:hypothetical protein
MTQQWQCGQRSQEQDGKGENRVFHVFSHFHFRRVNSRAGPLQDPGESDWMCAVRPAMALV